VAGCHETRAEAEAQSAALYANEPEATQEQEPGGPERCVCPECGHEAGKERGVPCRSMECSECGATMIAQTEDDDMGELTEAKTKDGHGRGDFLVVGDPEETSTWHLPVKTGGEPDRRLMGAAKAALTSEGGHRGNVYEGPDKAEALRKLKAMYDAEDMEWSESAVVQARNLIERALALLNETPGDNGHEPVAEDAAALSEAAIGRVIAIEEAETTAGLVPLTLDVALIEPGPGNAMDRHYYPAEVLRRDAGVFKGGKMYATDHRESAKDVGTWVSTIKACPVGFTESGAPIARVVVHKDWFARDIRALQAEGLLEKMECSIIGAGKAKKGTVNEQEYNIVEAITEGSADWVTRAGAGGRALALAESEPTNNGGEAVKEEKHEIECEKKKLGSSRKKRRKRATRSKRPTRTKRPKSPRRNRRTPNRQRRHCRQNALTSFSQSRGWARRRSGCSCDRTVTNRPYRTP